MFLGEKSKELRIYEKQRGGTKQWTPCLNLKSRQRETANLLLQTEKPDAKGLPKAKSYDGKKYSETSIKRTPSKPSPEINLYCPL